MNLDVTVEQMRKEQEHENGRGELLIAHSVDKY